MNTLKTTLLLALLTGMLVWVGYWFGGQEGATVAFIISLVVNFATYWFSDKFALATYRAREVTEQQAPRLHAIVADLAQQAGIPKPRMYMAQMPTPNAFATGRNPAHAVVVVTQSLLDLLNEQQLRAVLAHELGHVKNRDILISSVAATLAGALTYVAHMASWGAALLGSRANNRRANPLGMLVMVILTPIIATLIHLAISRSREFEADAASAHLTGAPRDLADALRILDGYAKRYPLQAQPRQEATASLFIVNPFNLSMLSRLFSTHPSTEERVERLERM